MASRLIPHCWADNKDLEYIGSAFQQGLKISQSPLLTKNKIQKLNLSLFFFWRIGSLSLGFLFVGWRLDLSNAQSNIYLHIFI